MGPPRTWGTAMIQVREQQFCAKPQGCRAPGKEITWKSWFPGLNHAKPSDTSWTGGASLFRTGSWVPVNPVSVWASNGPKSSRTMTSDRRRGLLLPNSMLFLYRRAMMKFSLSYKSSTHHSQFLILQIEERDLSYLGSNYRAESF